MLHNEIIHFIVMIFVGMLFNPMNILAYRLSDLYFSLTLFYGGLLMASNMIWSHEIIHFIIHNQLDKTKFIMGIFLSFFIAVFLLRSQFLINDTQWLKRMISHHSTAITTSNLIYNKTKNKKIKKLAKEIINTQEKEIKLMKSLI